MKLHGPYIGPPAALTPAQMAEKRGYTRGRHDLKRGADPISLAFDTAAEWNAWLRGWRCGQEELRQELALDAKRRSGYNSTVDGN